jgi:hypothetical protein
MQIENGFSRSDIMASVSSPEHPQWSVPIRDLGLKIAGTSLEPTLEEFQRELETAGIIKLRPDFYLCSEWGVPFPSISIGIPFYLARPDLLDVHAEHMGYLEGVGPTDLLRFLRHEMGHVVNYAYKLHEQQDWTDHFGQMTQPYVEEYRPEPFSRRHVRHLAGWYAQKHPDEDWAETFAVWMTPGFDWRSVYAKAPDALAKLEYCERTMAVINQREPPITTIDHDDDVSQLTISLEEFYREAAEFGESPLPLGFDAALKTIFEDFGSPEDRSSPAPRRPAEALILRMERDLVADVYRWTGHFPETTRRLVRHLALRARELHQVYPADRETAVVIAFTTLATSLAMNHVLKGHYIP